MTGDVPVGWPENYTGQVEISINRRGGSGEGRERQGECTHRRVLRLFVVQDFR